MDCMCGVRSVLLRESRAFCVHCFTDHFEKRVKRALKEKELKKGQNVLVVGELASYLFKKFVRVPVNVRFGTQWNGALRVIEWTEDDECVAFFESFAGESTSQRDDSLKILRFVGDRDALDYATLRGFTFLPRKKDGDLLWFISQFDDHMKHTLVRNADELRKIT